MDKTTAQRRQSPEYILILFIAAWLAASSVLNFFSRGEPDYLSLGYAGLPGLLPLVGLCALFSLLFGGLPRVLGTTREAHFYTGRLLFLAWLLFAASLLNWLKHTGTALSLLIALAASLVLARDILLRAVRQRHPADLALALAGTALAAANLLVIPWVEFSTSFSAFLSSQPGALLPLGMTSLGVLLALSYAFSRNSPFFQSRRAVLVTMLLAMALQIFLIGRISVARYEGLTTPSYDFGLFAQMFHSMAEGLGPLTTLERNMPLSHFKVHISPIYYLLLPFYQLFPTPATLQLAQAVIVASGIIPLALLAKGMGLDIPSRVAFCLIYLFSPALIASNFYDLHENCFLAPLILWLIWSLEKKSALGSALFTLLVLSVKEDAALYIWTLALFFMLEGRRVRTAVAMIMVSAGYFLAALGYLNEYGDGAMIDRFAGLIAVKEWSLLSVPYSAFRNPGFVLSRILSPDRLGYVIQMLAPLGFTPLFSRKLSRWVLLLPLLIMNLMMDWEYQYNIRFQYNYGSWVILLYLALLFFRDFSQGQGAADAKAPPPELDSIAKVPAAQSLAAPPLGRAPRALLILAMTSGIMISLTHLVDYDFYPQYLKKEAGTIASIKASLDEIPRESSVIATTFLTSYLSQRETLYDLEYNLNGQEYYPADYIVIDLRPGYADHTATVPLFLDDGYTIHTDKPEQLMILQKASPEPQEEETGQGL